MIINKIISIVFSSALLLTSSVYADDAAVFKKKCGVCHAVNSVSKGNVGPNLTGLAAKRPVDYIKAYMTNPADAKKKFADIYEKEVKGKYKATMPTTKVSETEMQAILNVLK